MAAFNVSALYGCALSVSAVLDMELQLALCAAVMLLVSTGLLYLVPISAVGWSVRVVRTLIHRVRLGSCRLVLF